MLTEYLEAAMKRANYEILPDGNTFYGDIPGFEGVYANSGNLETCRRELKEVLEEWVLLSISRHLPLPIIMYLPAEKPPGHLPSKSCRVTLFASWPFLPWCRC